MALPSWTENLSGETKESIQVRAKESLAAALDEEKEFERGLEIVKRIFPGK